MDLRKVLTQGQRDWTEDPYSKELCQVLKRDHLPQKLKNLLIVSAGSTDVRVRGAHADYHQIEALIQLLDEPMKEETDDDAT